MSLFIPATEGFLAALDRVTHERWLRIKVDTNEDGIPDTELTTTAAGWCNRASGSGKMEGSNNECVTNTWRFQLRNANKMYAEGDYANVAATVETKVGAGNEYITMFTGYVSDAGAERIMGAKNDDYVSFTLVDDFKMRAVNRKCESVFLVNYKILDTATPANSIFHVLAGYLGLEAGDLDVATIDYVKDFVGFDKKKDVLKELQDLASAYLGLLTFRYDGKLRLLSRFQTGYSEPSSEWTFNDDNITVSFSSVVSSILCNRVKTEYESRETLSARVVHKNVTAYDTETGKCSIAVPAGEYWPGPGDGDVGILSFVDPNSGEEWDTATERVQPTIGATGGGSDIESTGGVLTLESWEGAAGTNPAKTSAEYKGAQIILYNGTAGTVTITKLQIRGQPVRIDKLNRVEDIDSTITDDWNYRDKTIPGKFMANVDQAHETLNWWRQQGEAKRRAFKFSTYYFPIIQEGAIITVGSAGHEVEEVAARVLEYQHHCTGPVATWSTSIVAREWAAFTPSDEPYVEQEEKPSDTPTVTEKFDNTPTYADIISGFVKGGGTKTPTQPTILLYHPLGVNNIQLLVDRQLNLTNFDHYEWQVSDNEGVNVYELRFDGVDWKGDENEHTDWAPAVLNHTRIPPDGTEEAPTGRLLYYRCRRVTSEPVESAWSDWVSATTSLVDTGDIVEHSITVNKLAVGILQAMIAQIGEMLILDPNLGYGGQTDVTPVIGAIRWFLYMYGLRGQKYDGADWNTLISIGDIVNDVFQPYIRALALLHTNMDANALDIGAGPPDGATAYPFDNSLAPLSGSTAWAESSGISYSSATKKFGSHSLTAAIRGYLRTSAGACTLTACGISFWEYLPSSIKDEMLADFDDGNAGVSWTSDTTGAQRRNIALSLEGKIIYANGTSPGYIRKSIDGGNNWSDLTAAGSSTWGPIRCSGDGQIVVAVVENGYPWVSLDGGDTWSEKTGIGTILSGPLLCISWDGQKIAVCDYGGNLYTSEDGGDSWSDRGKLGAGFYYGLCCAKDGSYLTTALLGGNIYTSENWGGSWTDRGNTKNWGELACTPDGKTLYGIDQGVTRYIYKSTNGGANWSQLDLVAVKSFKSVAVSNDGLKIAVGAASGYIYTSADGGSSWTERSSSGTSTWLDIVVTPDGAMIVAHGLLSGAYKFNISMAKATGIGFLNGNIIRFYTRTASGIEIYNVSIDANNWHHLAISPQDNDIYGAVNGVDFVVSDAVLSGTGRLTLHVPSGIFIDDAAVLLAAEYAMAEAVAHYLAEVKWSLIDIEDDLVIGNSGKIYLLSSQLMIGDNSGTYPMGLKTIDSAVLAQNQIQTLPHGLGARPSRVQTSLLCVTAGYGFVAGDEVASFPNYFDGTTSFRWGIDADATNIKTYTSTAICVMRKDTGAAVAIVPGNWKFRIRCGI